jgi:hypothetical protein
MLESNNNNKFLSSGRPSQQADHQLASSKYQLSAQQVKMGAKLIALSDN